MQLLDILAGLGLLVWLYLLLGRDGFWRAGPYPDAGERPVAAVWPDVVAVVPARNEAAHVEAALSSLLAQDYPGRFRIVLVDDHSEDDTRARAERLAAGSNGRLEVIGAGPLPPGWTGKLWAMAEGVRAGGQAYPSARYLLFTDADIAHDRGNLTRLVAKAEDEPLDLVSLMVRLDCRGFWARLLIPAFVFFFKMLYPFAAVNEPSRKTAAAAGGCMLVRRAALDEAGGLAAIKDRLIDDVALARAIKHRPGGGRIWLGLASDTVSLRPYVGLGEIWSMVARTADVQLRHSLLRLAATCFGMTLVYLVPPLIALSWPLHGASTAATLAALIWLAMVIAYRSTARLYGQTAVRGLLLPLVAVFYLMMTVDSAVQYRRGRGGRWKGRVGAPAPRRRKDTTA